MNKIFKKTKKGFDVYIEYFSSSTAKTIILLLFVNIIVLWGNIYLIEKNPQGISHISSKLESPVKSRIAQAGACDPCLLNNASSPFLCTKIGGNSSSCSPTDLTNTDNSTVCVNCVDLVASLTVTPSNTPTLTPTASPTPTAGDANPTNSPTPTSTPTLAPTQAPSNTPVPTAAQDYGTAHVTFDVLIPGIGGDVWGGENNNPVRHARSFGIHFYNSQDNQIKQQEVTLTYNGSSYVGTATVTGIPMDSYTVRIELNNSLLKVIPGVVKLKNDTTTSTPQVTLVMGNIENSNGYHNVLDILDYNAFLKCFNGPCTGAEKQLSDLNDDDRIDVKDLNILLRGFSSRNSN